MKLRALSFKTETYNLRGHYFGWIKGRDFFHSFGLSYMPVPEHYTVLKEYGMVDEEDYEAQDRLAVQHARDWPWPQEQCIGSGWILPDGKFYPCEAYEHTSSQEHIILELGLTVAPHLIARAQNWIKVYHDLPIQADLDHAVTQRQVDTMWDLSQLPDQAPELKESLLYAIKEWSIT